MKLRQAGITDSRVLSAIEQVPRHHFVPDAFQERAWEDSALPISCGQTISQPQIVAWMTSALDVHDRMRVLEIGTGSGYQAAVLAKLCRMVYTIERHGDLLAEAEQRFKKLGLTNIVTQAGDGSKGWPHAAPFDRIMVTAAAAEIPKALLDQLAVGGIMIVPVGHTSETQMLLRIARTETGYDTHHLMPVRFVPLVEG